ncbi:hypothetical protein [Arvimicrobium flavum]|uniref:hypothetical protein n=1 Tax=Arvimicrobium flavum TaxID=3393320 RepID=UPI00237C4C30|nr:hypothetical protein [Mesorhizobium shangrilense]
MEARLERTEARVEKTLAEVKSEFSGMRADLALFREQTSSQLSHVPSKSFLVGTAIGIVAAVLAALGIGAAMFGNGIMVTTASVDRANQALTLAEENATQIQELTRGLQALLDKQAGSTTEPAPPTTGN